MLTLRLPACIAMLILLGSCTLSYPITAGFRDGRLVFVSEDNETTFAPWCWNNLEVFDGEGRTVWAFDAYEAFRNAKQCGPNFPLFYGEEPPGAQVTHRVDKLRLGTLYVVTGYAGGMSEGAFVLSKGGGRYIVNNVPIESTAVQTAFERRRQAGD